MIPDFVAALFGPSPRYKRAELDAVLAHGPAAVPPLIECLEAVLAAPEAVESDEWGHLYAVVLLAQLRAGHDVVVRLLRLPSDQVSDLFGDFATERFGGVLAATADGRTDGLKALMEDRDANTYARASAAEAMAFQVITHGADRDEALDYLAGFLDPDWSDGDYFLTGLACTLLDLGPLRHLDRLRSLHEQGEIEPFMIKAEELDPALHEFWEPRALHQQIARALPADLHGWLGDWQFGGRDAGTHVTAARAASRVAASRDHARKKAARKQQRAARKKQRGKRR